MSDRAMRVALVAIREITDDARVLTIVEEALAGRRERADGSPGPLTPAEKMKRYRERQAAARRASPEGLPLPGVTAIVTGVTEPVTESVTDGVTAAAPPDPPEIPSDLADLLPSERGSETRVRAASATGMTEVVTADVTAPVTLPRATNVTADGAHGLAVAAWAEGIRTVTRKPFSMPRGGSSELAELVQVIRDHCPDLAARVDWARAEGKRFAESYKGKLNAFSFRDWVNTPDEKRTQAAAPVEGPRVLEERARREREEREAERNWAPPPAEALALARGRPTPPKAGTGS